MSKLPSFLLESTPLEGSTSPIWLLSSLHLKRNFARHFFPAKMTGVEMEQTIEGVKETLLSKELEKPLFFKAEELDALDKEFLFEHFLGAPSFQNSLQGQGFIIDETKKVFALLNVEDHLQLQLIDCTAALEPSYARLAKMAAAIGSNRDYAFSPRFGYLTSDYTLCGTALVIQVYLHLPALIHTGQLQELLLKQGDETIESTGLNDYSLEAPLGDLLLLSNRYTLGLSEENILHSLNTATMKLMVAERALRTHLQQTNDPAMKDHISRAYGLLIHSYQLETKEALNSLSLIKLGVDLGWVTGIVDAKINELFFTCQHAHLAYLFKEPIPQQDFSKRRAAYLHQALSSVQLKI